jgi:hypothetical protein
MLSIWLPKIKGKKERNHMRTKFYYKIIIDKLLTLPKLLKKYNYPIKILKFLANPHWVSNGGPSAAGQQWRGRLRQGLQPALAGLSAAGRALVGPAACSSGLAAAE